MLTLHKFEPLESALRANEAVEDGWVRVRIRVRVRVRV